MGRLQLRHRRVDKVDVRKGEIVHRRKEEDSLADTTELVVVFPDERKPYWLGKNSLISPANNQSADDASEVEMESVESESL